MINIKTRIIAAAVLLPVFFAILFIFPPIILTVVVSVICGIAAYELLHATNMNKNKRVLIYTIFAAAVTPLSIYLSCIPAMTANAKLATEGVPATLGNPASTLLLFTLLFSLFFIFACLLLIETVLTIKNTKAIEKGTQLKFRQIPIALAAGMLIPILLSCIVILKAMPYGHLFVLLPVVATILTDSGAYFTGVTIGKRKAFPTISPNKTVEGYVGGTIAGILGMLIYGLILSYATTLTIIFPALILYGIIGAVVTELGDLAFSFIKRKCGIKDYGKLIPGHGGALDRFDSLTFTAPTMYLLVITIPAIIL